jgi:GT2 family glycosyltransferase
MAKVIFVAPIYNYDPILVHALALQTHPNWELLLIHDGPNSTGLQERLEQLNEPRVRYYKSSRRYDDWGHSLRDLGLKHIENEPIEGDFVVITNADNYYCPGFLKIMLAAFEASLVAVFCPMIHDHHGWRLLDAQLEHKHIDCGCVMVRREAALETGWTSREYAADWVYISQLVTRYGSHRLKKIDNVLFVHN